jgi:hypothetical protein
MVGLQLSEIAVICQPTALETEWATLTARERNVGLGFAASTRRHLNDVDVIRNLSLVKGFDRVAH